MDDYQTYLNALQSSNYVTQINQFNKQVADSKKESDFSGGSFMTTEAIQEGLTKVVSAIRTKVSDTATGLINKASETAKDAISTAKEAATEATQGVIKAGQEAATEAVQTGQQITSGLSDAVQMGQEMTSGIIKTIGSVKDVIPTQDEALSMLSQQTRQPLTSDLLPEGAGQIENDLPSAIAPAVDEQLTALHAQAMDSAFGAIQSRTGTQLTGGYEELSQSAGPRFNQLSTDIADEFEESGDILGGATNTLLSGSIRFTPQLSSVIDTATGAVEQGITSGLTTAQNAVSSIITPGLDTASSSIASLASTASGALDTASSAVSSVIASGLSATSGLSGAVDAAADAVQSGISTASGIASDVASTAIETAAGAATAGVDAVGAAIGSTVSEALGELGPIGLIVGGLAGGLTQLFEGAKEHANQVPVLNPAFQFL